MFVATGAAESISWSMPPTARACSQVRAHLETWLDGLQRDLVRTTILLASELTTLSVCGDQDENGKPIEFSVDLDAARVRLEVVRPGPSFAFTSSDAEVRDMSLCLLDQLADRWGLKLTGRGTAWWAELERWPG